MKILSIDFGSYSVKTILSEVTKSQVTHLAHTEYVLDHYREDQQSNLDTYKIITEEIVDNLTGNEKIVVQVPKEVLTTRFLLLPIKNKKKAEAMIPFQLEEEIPFLISDVHYATSIDVFKNTCKATVSICPKNEFDAIYQQLFKLLPNLAIATSEPSLYQTYFSIKQAQNSFAVLDLGHDTTEGHFFHNGDLTHTHRSFIAGRNINEMIEKNYNLEKEEAEFFKHQNSFFLTKALYNKVDDKQKVFGQHMDEVFAPLIQDIRRWLIGFKMSYAKDLETIYITGGTSNVKNITNYLTQKLNIRVTYLESFSGTEHKKIGKDQNIHNRMNLCNLTAISYQKRKRLNNFLYGNYQRIENEELPIDSMVYIATRSAVVAGILLLLFLVENSSLHSELKKLNSEFIKTAKSPIFKIPGRDIRAFKQNEKRVLRKLNQTESQLSQQVNVVQAALEVNSLAPLLHLSRLVNHEEVELIRYNSNDLNKTVTAIFQVKQKSEINEIEQRMKNIPGQDLRINKSPQDGKLEISYQY